MAREWNPPADTEEYDEFAEETFGMGERELELYHARRENDKWKVPEWMIGYLDLMIYNRDFLEELVNDNETTVFANAPRALMCVGAKDAAFLLTRLYDSNMLDPEGAAWEKGRKDRRAGVVRECPYHTSAYMEAWAEGWDFEDALQRDARNATEGLV